MKFIKFIFLPIHYAMVGFSLTVSTIQSFLCDLFNKIIFVLTKKENTKLQIFFSKQKDSPENLLLGVLYIVTIITLVNIFVPKNIETRNYQIKVFTYKDVNTIDNDQQIVNPYYDSSIDFSSLLKANPDVVAYLKVLDTNISYPVLKSTDNEYYLTHDFNRNYSPQKGSIFADYRNNFENLSLNTIIYGHHRLDNTMFGPLDILFEEEYYHSSSHEIILTTPLKTYVFRVFSTYEIEPEVYYLTTDFINEGAYLSFLNTLKSRSIFNYPESLSATDKIITLSTCNLYNTGRLVIHAKLVEEY